MAGATVVHVSTPAGEVGYIVTAFQGAYAIGLFLAGRIIDKVGTRIGYAFVVGIWGIADIFRGTTPCCCFEPTCRSGFRARGKRSPGSKVRSTTRRCGG